MASVSLNVLSENSASLRSLQLWSSWWLELYDSVRGLLGFSIDADLRAARVLNTALADRGWCEELWGVCGLLRGRRVCIIGGAASASEDIAACGLEDCEALVAVDGATLLLRDHGVAPSIVVTDLDGPWGPLVWAASAGSKLVIHGHGDNLCMLATFMDTLPRNAVVYGTVQVRPPGGCVHVSGGFTDGDRALAITVFCGASEAILFGMDFDAPVGPWSKPWLRRAVKPWPLKAKKLRIGKTLTRLLASLAEMLGQRVIRCSDRRGWAHA